MIQTLLIFLVRFIVNEYIIYYPSAQEELLKGAEHWHIDATFYIVPEKFYQQRNNRFVHTKLICAVLSQK